MKRKYLEFPDGNELLSSEVNRYLVFIPNLGLIEESTSPTDNPTNYKQETNVETNVEVKTETIVEEFPVINLERISYASTNTIEEVIPPKKSRGRPKGSYKKNKKKCTKK